MFIQTQPTPNPATLKFLPGQDVSPSTPYEFISDEEAAASPLAAALFGVTGVAGVFFGSDFVSITKSEDADWAVVKPQALAAIMDHFVSGAPLMADAGGERHLPLSRMTSSTKAKPPRSSPRSRN